MYSQFKQRKLDLIPQCVFCTPYGVAWLRWSSEAQVWNIIIGIYYATIYQSRKHCISEIRSKYRTMLRNIHRLRNVIFHRFDAGLISKSQWDKSTMQLTPPVWRLGQQIPELKMGQPLRLGNLKEFDSARVNNHGAMSCHGLGFFVGNGSGTVYMLRSVQKVIVLVAKRCQPRFIPLFFLDFPIIRHPFDGPKYVSQASNIERALCSYYEYSFTSSEAEAFFSVSKVLKLHHAIISSMVYCEEGRNHKRRSSKCTGRLSKRALCSQSTASNSLCREAFIPPIIHLSYPFIPLRWLKSRWNGLHKVLI